MRCRGAGEEGRRRNERKGGGTKEVVRKKRIFLNHFRIQETVSLLKPPCGGFRSKTAVA
jgi:hypothetical protein